MANCMARIQCGNCGRSWDVFWRDINMEDANVCPYCGETLNQTIWDTGAKTAAAAVLDCNMELQRHAEGYGKPRFVVSFFSSK